MIIRNDRGNPTSSPCGATVFGLCGAGDYDSWYQTAQVMASKMQQVNDPRAEAWLAEFDKARPSNSIFTAFLPTDQTNQLARWVQVGADLLDEMGLEGIPGANIPSTITRNEDLPKAPGAEASADIFKGVLILGGVIAVTAVAVAIIKK